MNWRGKRNRRETGSKPGKLNSKDVGVSAAESAGWSLSIGGAVEAVNLFGHQLQDSIPWIALSFPLEVVAGTAAVAFLLIFLTKLWMQKRSDNRTGSK